MVLAKHNKKKCDTRVIKGYIDGTCLSNEFEVTGFKSKYMGEGEYEYLRLKAITDNNLSGWSIGDK